MARNSGGNIVPIRNGHGRYPTGTPGGPDRAAALRLAEAFLRDLQADWAQHGKEILEVMRKKHQGSTSNAWSSLHWFKRLSLTSLSRSSGNTHLKKS